MELDEMQKRVVKYKVDKGFNMTNVETEFCLMYGEAGEAFDAYRKKKSDLGEELADVAIYLLGLADMLGFSLQNEVEKKMKINESRQYEMVNGILVKKK